MMLEIDHSQGGQVFTFQTIIYIMLKKRQTKFLELPFECI